MAIKPADSCHEGFSGSICKAKATGLAYPCKDVIQALDVTFDLQGCVQLLQHCIASLILSMLRA